MINRSPIRRWLQQSAAFVTDIRLHRSLRGDPLLSLIDRLTTKRVWLVWLAAICIHGFLGIGAGIIISRFYEIRDREFLSVLDVREMPLAVFILMIVMPLIWALYAWQPKQVIQCINLLHENEVIGEAKDSRTSLGRFTCTATKSLNCDLGGLLAAIATVAIAIVWILNLSPSNPLLHGFPYAWWDINPWYFWLCFVPLLSVSYYMMAWIVLRQIAAIAIFARLFDAFEVHPKLFHPDLCNGFAPIGDFALRLALIIIVFGCWVCMLIAFQMLFDQPINTKIDTTILLIAYVLMVPITLFPPAWSAHAVMVEAKQRALNSLAKRIQHELYESDAERMVTNRDLLELLEARYDLMQREFKNWPFRPIALRNFGVSSLAPFLTSTGFIFFQEYVATLL